MTLATTQPEAEVRVDAALVTSLIARSSARSGRLCARGAIRGQGRGRVAPGRRMGRQAAPAASVGRSTRDRGRLAPPHRRRMAVQGPRSGARRIPDHRFPWRWSVVPWVPGEPASKAPLSRVGAPNSAARSPRSMPRRRFRPPGTPGSRSRSRSRNARCEDRLTTLARRTDGTAWRLNSDAACRILDQGASVPRPAATWTHLDLKGQHILTRPRRPRRHHRLGRRRRRRPRGRHRPMPRPAPHEPLGRLHRGARRARHADLCAGPAPRRSTTRRCSRCRPTRPTSRPAGSPCGRSASRSTTRSLPKAPRGDITLTL